MGENPVYSAILSRYDVGAPTGITISLPGAESQVFVRLTQRDHSSLMTSGVFFYHNNCFPIFYTINHGHISPLILPIYGRRDGRHPSAYLSPCTLTNIENTFLGCREEKADCTAGSLRFYRLNNSLTEISWSFLRAAVQGRGGREPVAKLGWGEGGGRQSCHCFSWDWLCWLHWVRVKQVRYILVSSHRISSYLIWPFTPSMRSFSKDFTSFACSPSPLVQLAETPDEVVVSKDWAAQVDLSFYSM